MPPRHGHTHTHTYTPTSQDLRGELDNRHQNKDLVYLGETGEWAHQQAGGPGREI